MLLIIKQFFFFFYRVLFELVHMKWTVITKISPPISKLLGEFRDEGFN